MTGEVTDRDWRCPWLVPVDIDVRFLDNPLRLSSLPVLLVFRVMGGVDGAIFSVTGMMSVSFFDHETSRPLAALSDERCFFPPPKGQKPIV